MNRQKELGKISENIKNCTKCRLWKNRVMAVPGEGNVNSSVMFIGEAPGEKENRTGRPFVGRSGKLLDEFMTLNDIKRKNVYLTSVIKCHPPKNRNPKTDELNTCINNWLNKQIKMINPSLIVLLGRVAVKSMTGKNKVGRYHGKIISKEDMDFFITYHPAAGLRNPKFRKNIEHDFKKIKKHI